MLFLFTECKFLSNMVSNIFMKPLSSWPKRSSPWDDKVPCNILLLCQKKMASSYLLLTPPMFIISSFTLKYHCLGSSHNPHEKLCSAPKFYLYWLLWVASRTFFFQSVSHAKRLINIHAVGFSWLQDYQF